ncbi:DNA translocase FtsK [Nonomuraea sp. NPDC046802]|uniref:DNA translocase FtsK n=1 Tax=Nonomuraea sp. NPDC046802 TaxID=3154919 RepID=UPI0033C08B62
MSDLMDDVRDDGPSESEVLGWEGANAHADEWPNDDESPGGDVASLLERQLDRLGETLFDRVARLDDTIDRLDEYIERRAQQIAAPHIAEAERRAAAAEQRAEQAEQAHEQRLGDLRAELVRQMGVMDRQLDRLLWLAQYLPAPLRQLALPMPSALARLADKLPDRWRAMVARRASLDFDPAADAELQLLAEGITLVVRSQSAARFQNRMRVGFAKAQTLLGRMEELGVISPMVGTKRKVLVEPEALPELLASLGITVDETRSAR